MSTPFNMIYQAAYDRENEIREQAAQEYDMTTERPRKQGWLASIEGALFDKTYDEQYYRTTTPNECVQASEYR